ncbi:pirin family protein [Serratia fonticola]|jgi:redox-sensitive bicupin YhaK (pirin superfamily)|uniref:Pirin family protein n=1 Tax=Serratia fonticola TaxID=47917 RepID=A0A0F7D248_SERFO|nr:MULTISPECIES: pirin family protein [Serratia]AKG70110.1 quercetin 2,3-dioxygenase [Serratia fonticola]ATM75127.1 pirin family protein [Serratia fonticola]AYM93796.1 pirin family protein [Serratia sp. 3ACOL1]MBC3231458.1 pirin family protein [Serratia fonticola]MBE0151202.1 pirin family protein [Serratia fonticola]
MKKILGVYNSPEAHWVGNGFLVNSLFSYNELGAEMSPFLLLDHAAPTKFRSHSGRRGVGQHPHRGFETVTIVYQGEVEHRDSTGSGGVIGPGDVQWMTAASGILHEEFHSKDFSQKGGTIEMVQLWVNLPAKDKMAAPGYQTLLNQDIPVVPLADNAGQVRVIAGNYGGHAGPARTFSPINVWDMKLNAGHTTTLQVEEGHTLAVVMLHGAILVNGEQIVRETQMVLLDRAGDSITLEANGDVSLLVLSGEPIDEPIVGYGPFVMNSEAEIQQAFRDFNSGQFGAMPLTTAGSNQ